MTRSRLALATEARKEQLKARVAFDGPSGAGKTWTALEWATVLADGGRVLVIDTERRSSALYADRFQFELVPWDPPYHPADLADTITDASRAYDVIVVDSLSHFWEGEGGTRDIVDAEAERARGNTFAGWKVGTPTLRHLIDTMLAVDAHFIATMRSKMEYVLEADERGRQVPRKVGMAPVMRQGVEYEFTLVGDMDHAHRISVSKSRCDVLADQLIQPGRAADAARDFAAWLNTGDAPAPVPAAAAKQRLLRACDGDRAVAAALWGDRGSNPIPHEDLDRMLQQASQPNAAGVATHDGPAPDGAQENGVDAYPPGEEETGKSPAFGDQVPAPSDPDGVDSDVVEAEIVDRDPASQSQLAALHAALNEVKGVGFRGPQKYAWLSAELGRPVASASELDREECALLIGRLNAERHAR
jgi:hypothetical protein